ncbi:hypothetical protein [Streptomyces eurythermus]
MAMSRTGAAIRQVTAHPGKAAGPEGVLAGESLSVAYCATSR